MTESALISMATQPGYNVHYGREQNHLKSLVLMQVVQLRI